MCEVLAQPPQTRNVRVPPGTKRAADMILKVLGRFLGAFSKFAGNVQRWQHSGHWIVRYSLGFRASSRRFILVVRLGTIPRNVGEVIIRPETAPPFGSLIGSWRCMTEHALTT